MKRVKQLASVVLAAVLLVSGVPFSVSAATTGFHNGDVVYERWGNGGNNSDEENCFLNLSLTYTAYQFMQTEDNQEFTFDQDLWMQKGRGWAYVVGKDWSLYTGGHSDAENVEEHGIITNNPTAEFVNTYGGGWLATDPQRLNDNATNMTGFPDGEFPIEGGTFDTSGCYNYYFRYTFNFHGRPAGDYGEIDTGYVWNLELYWARTDTVFNTKKTTYVRMGTDVTVTDVRELNNTIAAKQAELADPNAHLTDEYRYNTLQTLNSIPADMQDGSTFYTQAEVDAYVDALNGVTNDVADYSAYEAKYAEAEVLVSDNNSNNKYNAAAYAEFVADVTGLNAALDRGLPASQQAAVNTATRLMQQAIDKLLANPNLQNELEQAISDAQAALDPTQNGGTSYMSATADALQQAIAAAQTVAADTDATTAEQAGAIADITAAINGLVATADASAYEAKKTAAEAVTNTDETYDADAFAQYQQSVAEITQQVIAAGEIPNTDQGRAVYTDAVAALENAMAQLEQYRNIFITYVDDAGTVLHKTALLPNSLYGAVKDNAPALPKDDTFRYFGWQTADGTLVTDDKAFDADVTVSYAKEYKVLKPVANSGITLAADQTADTYHVFGVAPGTTLADVLARFENDNLTVLDLIGADVAAADVVGTGTTVTVVSRYDRTVYQTWRLVVMGDVNGDAFVTADDYDTSKAVSLGEQQYLATEKHFFAANDLNDDGVIDALDCRLVKLLAQGKDIPA